MRIGCLIPYFSDTFGGPVRHVKMVSRMLELRGHETVIFTTNLADKEGRTAEFNDEVFDVRAFPVSWAIGDYFFTPAMKDALRQARLDLLHAHCYRNYQAELGGWLSKKTGKPLILTAHGTVRKFPKWRDWVMKGAYDLMTRGRVLKVSSRVVALSDEEVRDYQSAGVPRDRIVKIPHGVDVDRFRPGLHGDAVRLELGLGDGPIVLYAGRIHWRKGIQHLVRAFAKIVADFPDARLLICGPEYGYLENLQKEISSASLGNHVVLAGWIPDDLMPAVYSASSVVALPAQGEVFGLVLTEAAASGKAIITTRWGWASEFFEDGKDCVFLENPDDVDGLAGALRTLLEDPHLCQVLGTAARRKVLQTLSWELCAIRHEELYSEALSGS